MSAWTPSSSWEAWLKASIAGSICSLNASIFACAASAAARLAGMASFGAASACRPGGAEGCERYEGDEEMASKTEQEEDLPVGLVRIARGIDRLIETGQGLNQKASKADG